jgi:hypothetical protein
MVQNAQLTLLLRNIDDPVVQENFRKLKAYIEVLAAGQINNTEEISSASDFGNTVVMDTSVTAQKGDLVYLDLERTNYARPSHNNTPPSRFIGLVIKKLNATRAEVQMYGIIDVDLPTGPVFAGENGGLRIGIPSTGITQKLGFSFGNGKMLLSPNRNRIKIN